MDQSSSDKLRLIILFDIGYRGFLDIDLRYLGAG
jgi:hypothetical protein